jgi:hypothetical protein
MDFDQEYLQSKIMKSSDGLLDMKLDTDGVMRYYLPEAEVAMEETPAPAAAPSLPEVVVTGSLPKPEKKAVKPPVSPKQGQLDLGEAKAIQPTGAMSALKSVGQLIQSGAEKIDFDVLGLPGIGTLTLKDLTVGDLGKVLVNIAEGFPPVTGSGQTLSPTMESAELINLAPVAGAAYKGGKMLAKGVVSGTKSLAPVAGEMIENYLTKTGAILKVAPDGKGIEVPSAPKINTPAFKNWFGNSKAVDNKGNPAVWYHGSLKEFDEFKKPSSSSAIFFSPQADFASSFANISKGNVLPVYLKAVNTFDYDNPKHREAVIKLAIENTPIYKNAPDQAGMRRVLEESLTNKNTGNWTTIEEKGFQDAIKSLGFDSFYVKERGIKNIGVYDPAQIKSVFNKGTFDPKDPRILYSGGAAGAGTGTAIADKEKK